MHRRTAAALLQVLAHAAFAQSPPPYDPSRPPPPGLPPPGAPPPPDVYGRPPPPPLPPPPGAGPVDAPRDVPAVVAPAEKPLAPIAPLDAVPTTTDDRAATSEVASQIGDSPATAHPDAVASPTAQTEASSLPMANAGKPATPVSSDPPAAASTSSRSVASWVVGLALALLALGAAIGRGRRLQAEKHALSQRQQRLQTAHVALRAESEQLRQLAVLDPLTGTYNRGAFTAELRERLDYLSRAGRLLDLVVFDLDHFKAINDRLGHLAGDAALKLVAGIVREHLDSDDVFGRFGGDEFLIACADQGTDAVAALAERIRAAVEARAVHHEPPLAGLSLSMGIAAANPETGYDADDLFARADAALYRAKRAGRNRVVVCDSSLAIDDAPATHRHL